MSKVPPRLKGARKGYRKCRDVFERLQRSAYMRMMAAMNQYGILSDQYAAAKGEHDEIEYIIKRGIYLVEGRADDLGIRKKGGADSG